MQKNAWLLSLFLIISLKLLAAEKDYCPYDIMYAPWRETYENSFKKSSIAGCSLCAVINNQTTDIIFKKSNNVVIIPNKYPYTPGHILVIPNEHAASLWELSPKVREELMEAITLASCVATETLSASGVNIGFNIGNCSGATIPGHIHCHIVPRNCNDNYFLSTIANTRVYTRDIDYINMLLLKAFQAYQ